MPNFEPPRVCVHPEAQVYAQVHGLSLPDIVPMRSVPHAADQFQLISHHGLALQPLQLGKVKPLQVDFVHGQLAHRRQFGGGRKQDIARACGLHQQPGLSILDATAGLGRDSFVLAGLGAHVHMVERNLVLAALLQDGIVRALTSADDDARAVMTRLRLSVGDVLVLPAAQVGRPDVIYLDPMFPPRDKSAKVKADMQILHNLLPETAEPDAFAEQPLLQWALDTAIKRVVVKRPRVAAPLGERAPDHQLIGKANRFDVYTLKRLVP